MKQTAPDGLTATIAYTPTSTTVTAPDGHVTVETTDLLGRTVKETDNIHDGKLVDDLAARTLRSMEYSEDGLTAKVTDGAGRVTVTTNDALGRPVMTVAPNGMTQVTAYNEAATTGTSVKTTAILPVGEGDPAEAVAVTTETYHHAERPIVSARSYADKTPTAPTSQAFDGLGRVSQNTSGDVATTPSYDGPGGTVRETTLTPRNSGAFPGSEVTADTERDLTGAPVVKTLTPASGDGRSGSTVVRDKAGRITSESDQRGGTTSLTYTRAGQVRESVSPTGVKTVFSYEDKTGRTLQVSVTSADGKTVERTAYTHDPTTGRITEVYDPANKSGTVIGYTYDADGNVLGVAYPDGKTLTQTFDNHGQRLSLTDTAGLTTRYTYHRDGTLKNAVQRQGDTAHGMVKAEIGYTYDGLGRISEIRRGGGDGGEGITITITTTYAYTDANQVKSEKTLRG